MPLMRIGMWWCALLGKNTHKLRNDAGTMAIKYVIPYQNLNDAVAIYEAVQHPSTRFVPAPQATNHPICAHKFRERTALMNRIRALPFEFGLIINIELFIDYNSLFFFLGIETLPLSFDVMSPVTACKDRHFHTYIDDR